jgi:hypothetical protein
MTFGDTVFVLRVLGTLSNQAEYWAIYLRVSGEVDRDNFARLLRGYEVDGKIRESDLLEVGFVPDNPAKPGNETGVT